MFVEKSIYPFARLSTRVKGFCLFVFILLTTLIGSAAELPIDPDLRHGTLPCGITYYIRHNAYPQGRAEMWMVHRVGSVVEADNEAGYTHLLEHLAFNGTTHFAGSDIVNYFARQGMSYGGDINASTAFGDTQYQLSHIPTARWSVLDSALLAMSDLSCRLTLTTDAIAKEKAIVEEEWRHRDGYTMRMFDAVLPQLLGDSRYATRIPIGNMAVVRQATHDDIARFYHHWFRPDLQAIVIVGDFDAAAMESHLREAFASVECPSTPCPDTNVALHLNPGITFARYSDDEAGPTTVRLFYPLAMAPQRQSNTSEALRSNVARQLVAQMITERIDQRLRDARTHVLSGGCIVDKYLTVDGLDALTITATSGETDARPLLGELLTEVRRVVQHGFTTDELRRACANYRASIDQALAEIDHHESRDYVDEYIDHFLHGGYIPGIECECKLIGQVLDTIDVADINLTAKTLLCTPAISVVATGRNAQGLPTSSEVESMAREINSTDTEAPDKPQNVEKRLINGAIAIGRIVEEKTDSTGVTTMTLSNGATVQLLPTNWQNNEVLFGAIRPGGTRACSEQLDTEMRLIDDVVECSALGGWSQNDLRLMLNGVPLSLAYSMGDGEDALAGNCRPSDLETLLQLNYLYFTDVTPDTTAWRTLRRQMLAVARQQHDNTDAVFADSVSATLYQHRPLHRPLREAEIENADFEKVLSLYRQRVAPVQQFTFSLVGNIDIDSLRPLVERYLASIVNNVFLTPMPSPKSSVYACMMGPMEHSLRNQALIDIAGQVLAVALNAHLREDLKATYGVEAHGAASRLNGKWMLSSQFDAQPEMTQTLLSEVARVFDIIMSYGTTGELLEHIKQQMLQQLDTDVRTNAYWLGVMNNRAIGFDSHTGYRQLLETLSLAELNAFVVSLEPTLRMWVVMQGY